MCAIGGQEQQNSRKKFIGGGARNPFDSISPIRQRQATAPCLPTTRCGCYTPHKSKPCIASLFVGGESSPIWKNDRRGSAVHSERLTCLLAPHGLGLRRVAVILPDDGKGLCGVPYRTRLGRTPPLTSLLLTSFNPRLNRPGAPLLVQAFLRRTQVGQVIRRLDSPTGITICRPRIRDQVLHSNTDRTVPYRRPDNP